MRNRFLRSILESVKEKASEARIAALEARVAELEVEHQQLWKVMRGELAMDGQTPLQPNPRDTKRDAMSAVARKRLRQQQAAHARASKPKGKGKGAVKTKQMQRKLKKQAGEAS